MKRYNDTCDLCGCAGKPKKKYNHLEWLCSCDHTWETMGWAASNIENQKEWAKEAEEYERLREKSKNISWWRRL